MSGFLTFLCALRLLAAFGEGAPGAVLVPAGTYTPLFRGESDLKNAPVQAFWMDVFPVTNADFLEFVKANPKWRRSKVKRIFADSDYLRHWAADTELGSAAPANAPVVYVSWFAANAYCRTQRKRLPTTLEWEYVAAASPSRPDGDKDPAFVAKIRAWYSSPADQAPRAVGQGIANLHGVHDLHGLVWEWVSDFSTAMVTGDSRGDTGLERQLFCGGASQGAGDRDNFPAFMRYGFRSSLQASYTIHNLGFRCAKNLPGNSETNR
ncbi:MAG TPA: formylglycine-generating enzyme family protein [Verrucomicrobiae bacterium]|nr:formylglycine-generating enzyme family protein [Verrucomicrobiae bacterium]